MKWSDYEGPRGPHSRVYSLSRSLCERVTQADLSGRIRTCGQNKLNAHLFGEERAQELYAGLGEVAFRTRAGAWRIARNELTMRPLLQSQLSISSKLIARANDSSRVVSEFVRTLKEKLDSPRRIRLDLLFR
jgi:hypothetical protein